MSLEKIYEMILSLYQSNMDESDRLRRYEDLGDFDTLLNSFAKNDGSLKIVLDNIKYRILAISENLEALSGFKKTDVDKYNTFLFLKALTLDHIIAPLNLANWYGSIAADSQPIRNLL